MHFVTGGAFHGKKKWVHAFYQLEKEQNVTTINGYKLKRKEDFFLPKEGYCLIYGVEIIIKNFFCLEDGRLAFQLFLEDWMNWEEASDRRQLIIIGTEIGKGIVPIDKSDRLWRDMVGWCYQDIAAAAKRVDIIWYGLPETIKDNNTK